MVSLESLPKPDGAIAADERVFAELFDHSPMPLLVTSLIRDRVLAVNGRAGDVLGVPAWNAVGRPVTSFYADPADRELLLRALRETGRVDDRQLRLKRRDGSILWVLASCRRVRWDGEQAILTGFADLTPQLEAEQALAASEHRLVEQSRTLTALTERSASGVPFEDRVHEILRMAAAALGIERLSVWCFARDMRSIECIALHQRSAPRDVVGSRISADECPSYFAALGAERVIAAHDARTDPRTAGFTTWYLEPNRIGAMLDVPLRHSGGMQGVLCGEHVGGARTWTLDEQNFAIASANLVAVALADAERSRTLAQLAESEARATAARAHAEESRDQLDRELASAGRMQKAILPLSLPVRDRVRFAAGYQTSRHAGGDYYDVVPIDANRFAIVVADVSGHGANAAMVMAMIRTVVHAYPGPLDDPPAVLRHINRHFRYLWDTAMYATAIVAVLDLERQVIRLSSAGHPAPVVLRGGHVGPFPAVNGLPLFWDEFGDMPVVEERLGPGDRVVFYSDGITDRCGPDDTRFDPPRLMETLARANRLDLAAMVDALRLELDTFAGAAEPEDDQTVLAIEVLG